MYYRKVARRSGLVVTTAVYATLLAGCGDGTEPLIPAAVEIVAGNGQSAAAGAAVAVAPSVKVVTSKGKAVPNVRVTFVPTAESGAVVGGTQVTNASGIATVTSWTLGTKAGASTLTVTAEGVAPVTLSATTTAGPAASAAVYAGNTQSGLVGSALQVAPAVLVSDAYGNPVAGASVSFAVTNGGSIEGAAAQTDAAGVATAGKWTLGTVAGQQVLTATVTGAGSVTPVSFSALAIADIATQLVITRQPAMTNASGQALSTQPALEFRDRFNNVATSATLPVTASIATGTGTLGGTTTVNALAGRVNFTNLTFTGSGAVQLRFSTTGLADVTSTAFTVAAIAPCAGPSLTLNYTIGQSARYIASSSTLPRCLNFSATANAGQQYLVMFENMSRTGAYASGVFPGSQSDDGLFDVTIQTRGTSSSQTSAPIASAQQWVDAPADAVHGWDFGGQHVYEVEPKSAPGTNPGAKILRNGEWISASGSASIQVGDTLQVMMEGISRLGIPATTQRAVVRLVAPDIVIAEDVRIARGDATFTRSSGTLNTPIAQADLEEIAREYSQYARVMADRFFAGGHNGATTQDPGRPIAVHSLMSADNIWGYTYSDVNYFVWDYWVSSNGSTKTIAQHAQRNSDNLFMHEIAHMRHWGLLERSGRTGLRGNRWLVEGFARGSERLPIAMRLLGTSDPSRTQNLTLPFNPAYKLPDGRQQYFLDDVPAYMASPMNMYEGYGASSYVFDYFADQVASNGGNWWTALSDLLINAGSETDLNTVINRYLPGVDFATLFTRARIALYADDYGTAGLPTWTQYTMYNLRLSRPPSTQSAFDPRNMFPRITPGTAFNDARAIISGGAFGYLIDGVSATTDTRIDITPSAAPNGVVTIVRIK